MSPRLLSTREIVVWTTCFLAVATLIVASGFTSDDPDSALYAGLADRLSQEPIRRWLVPEWWGFWPDAQMTGPFREHPAGVFLLPAALSLIGIPAVQGAYVVGLAAGLGSVLMMAWLIGQLTTRDDARAALVLLQLMPVAFIFRLRANHEYPMLACLLVALIGLVSVSKGRPLWRGTALVALGLTGGLFIKGVFTIKIVLALAVWAFVNPVGRAEMRARQVTSIGVGIGVMLAGALAYDAAYRAVAGDGFWAAYWQRQLGPLAAVTPFEVAMTILRNVAFYVSRLLWHPAPWSFALLVAGWRMRPHGPASWHELSEPVRRGLIFTLVFAGLAVLILSPVARYAERYAFSATYAIAGASVVAAYRGWPRLRQALRRLDEGVVAFPALLWLMLVLLRLGAGPLLPRV